MKKLTQLAFQRAKNFIMDHGRALDQRRFEFHFEDGSADAVLAALTPYQNDDGGFAHSLEPDIRTPFSSAIVTTVGFPDSQRNSSTCKSRIGTEGNRVFYRHL